MENAPACRANAPLRPAGTQTRRSPDQPNTLVCTLYRFQRLARARPRHADECRTGGTIEPMHRDDVSRPALVHALAAETVPVPYTTPQDVAAIRGVERLRASNRRRPSTRSFTPAASKRVLTLGMMSSTTDGPVARGPANARLSASRARLTMTAFGTARKGSPWRPTRRGRLSDLPALRQPKTRHSHARHPSADRVRDAPERSRCGLQLGGT